jgi:hypothetical protein
VAAAVVVMPVVAMMAEMAAAVMAEVPAVMVMPEVATAVIADLGRTGLGAGDLRREGGGGGLRALRRGEDHRADEGENDREGPQQSGS